MYWLDFFLPFSPNLVICHFPTHQSATYFKSEINSVYTSLHTLDYPLLQQISQRTGNRCRSSYRLSASSSCTRSVWETVREILLRCANPYNIRIPARIILIQTNLYQLGYFWDVERLYRHHYTIMVSKSSNYTRNSREKWLCPPFQKLISRRGTYEKQQDLCLCLN